MLYGYITVHLVVDKPQLFKVKNVMTNHITTGNETCLIVCPVAWTTTRASVPSCGRHT